MALMTRTARSAWLGGPARLAWLMMAVVLTSSFKVRERDPTLATSGVVDAQIGVELLVWGAAAALAVARIVSTRTTPLNTPARLHPVLRWQGALFGLFLVTSLWSPSQPVSVVRAGQLAIMFVLGVTALAEFDREGIERLWISVRRVAWMATVTGVVLTSVLPLWQPFVVGFAGDVRFRMFAMHPISTGNFLGFALLALVTTWFGTSEPWFERRGGSLIRLLAAVSFAGLLVATGSRGAMVATLAAVGLAVLLSPRRSVRSVILLAGAASVLVVAAGFGATALAEVALRGQDLADVARLSGRFELAAAAVPLLEDRVLFGHGYLAARSVFLQLAWGAGESHNMLLEILFSTGLFGLVLLAGFLGSLAKTIVIGGFGERPLARQAAPLLLWPLLNGVVASGFIAGPGTGLLAITLAVMFAVRDS